MSKNQKEEKILQELARDVLKKAKKRASSVQSEPPPTPQPKPKEKK